MEMSQERVCNVCRQESETRKSGGDDFFFKYLNKRSRGASMCQFSICIGSGYAYRVGQDVKTYKYIVKRPILKWKYIFQRVFIIGFSQIYREKPCVQSIEYLNINYVRNIRRDRRTCISSHTDIHSPTSDRKIFQLTMSVTVDKQYIGHLSSSFEFLLLFARTSPRRFSNGILCTYTI